MRAAANALQQQSPEDREGELLRLLKAEENDALGYRQSQLQQVLIDSLKHFYGEPYGDEEDGRSQVRTREVFESIEWTIPDLMRVFASGGNVIYLEETNPQDSKYAQDAADYLNWIFTVDNHGYELLHDFAFDGLLHRRGFLACYWRDKEYHPPQTLTGLNIMQVQQLMQDPSVEIIGQNFDEESEVGGIMLKVRRTKSEARAEVVGVAPEDMRLNGRAVDIDHARYVGRVLRMFRGEVMRMWPEKADQVAQYSGTAVSGPANVRRGQDVRMERFGDNSEDWQAIGNNAAQELQVLEEYLRVDLDGDGYPEMIRAYRLGDLILEESEVNENPFGSWTPIRIPHRFYGLSMHDIVQDLQRRSTVLTRAALDATYQSVVNREAFDATKVDVDALLATYAGAKVPVQGSPGDAIMPLIGGVDTANAAWEAINQLQSTLENRTGATRQTQGLDPDALLKGAHSGKAIDLLQTAGGARKEVMARNMGAGLERFFAKLYRMVCRNQNAPRAARVGGKWAQFDPRTWNSDLRVHIHTGLGTGNRDQTLMGLQMLGQLQQTIVEFLGPDNPNVTLENVYALQEETCRALGYRSCEKFFTEPPRVPDVDENGQPKMGEDGQPQTKPWSPPPKPDPVIEKAKLDAQIQMQIGQAKMQQEDAHLQLQFQKDAELARIQQQDDQVRAQVDAEDKAKQHELNVFQAQVDAEAKAREHAHKAAELEAKRAKDEADVQIKMEELRLRAMEIEARNKVEEAKLKDGKAARREQRMADGLATERDQDEHEDDDAPEEGGPSTRQMMVEVMERLAEVLSRPRNLKVVRDEMGRVVGAADAEHVQ